MQTQRPSDYAALVLAQAYAETQTQADELGAAPPTCEPSSRSRQEGVVWAERLFAQARVCSSDCARFAAVLGY